MIFGELRVLRRSIRSLGVGRAMVLVRWKACPGLAASLCGCDMVRLICVSCVRLGDEACLRHVRA
jgi:hypothetical protein